MQRRLVPMVAVLLACFCTSWALAAPAGKQKPKKKTAAGVIEKVNAKNQTFAVKPSAGQQIQTQQAAAQKGQKKRPAAKRLVFQVDADTKIVVKGAQQATPKGLPADQKENPKFNLLQVGQVVRVIYVVQQPVQPEQKDQPDQKVDPKQKPEQEATPEQKPEQKPDQKPDQKVDPKQKPEQKVDPKQKPDQKVETGQKGAPRQKAKPPRAEKGKPKLVFRALRIDVLAQSTAEQEAPAQK